MSTRWGKAQCIAPLGQLMREGSGMGPDKGKDTGPLRPSMGFFHRLHEKDSCVLPDLEAAGFPAVLGEGTCIFPNTEALPCGF